MRTVSAPELARLLGPEKAYHLRVEVHDSEGAFTDYSVLSGIDWQISASLSEDIDTPIMTGEIRLAREVDGDSLAPFMEGSSLNEDSLGAYAPRLNVGRPVRLYEEVTDVGVAPTGTDEHLVFDGYIDELDWATDDIVLRVSDLGSRLVKTFIEIEEVYGDDAGTAVEGEMQEIIDRWVASPPTLVTPVSPGWMVKQWRQGFTNVFEAIRTLALQIGWEVRYRFAATGDTFQLTFYEPDRAKTTPDVTIGPDTYFDLSAIQISDADIRNVVRVRYTDATTGAASLIEATDAASIAIFGRRFMEIEEDASSNIDTSVEAQAMADAAVADLATPFADHAIQCPHLWFVQLEDLIRHSANAVHYDVDQDFAVVAIRREWAEGEGTMTIQTRGKPAGAYRRWLALGGGAVIPPVTSGVPILTLYEFEGEGSADGGQPYGMAHFGLRWGRNCHEVHIHASRSATPSQGYPPADNRHESGLLTRPEGDIPQAEDWEELWSIRTETNDWRAIGIVARNLSTGQENIRQLAEVQAVDSGTGPSGNPTGLTVTPNGTTMEVRWTNVDALSDTLIYRNGRNVAREAAGGPGAFDDTGLDTSVPYNYEVIHYRSGQTSGAPTAPPPQGGGGSSDASAPQWQSGYPLGGVDGGGNPRVALWWVGDGGYLASVDVEESAPAVFNPPFFTQPFNWVTLLAAQAVNPAAPIDDLTYPNGTDRYFRLKGNPINPADPPLYSVAKLARYGTSTLP